MEKELYDISVALRDLLREVDEKMLSRDQMMQRILTMSDEYMEKYEDVLLERLVDEQNDPNNPRFDYGL